MIVEHQLIGWICLDTRKNFVFELYGPNLKSFTFFGQIDDSYNVKLIKLSYVKSLGLKLKFQRVPQRSCYPQHLDSLLQASSFRYINYSSAYFFLQIYFIYVYIH